jgi:hypothetical protein
VLDIAGFTVLLLVDSVYEYGQHSPLFATRTLRIGRYSTSVVYFLLDMDHLKNLWCCEGKPAPRDDRAMQTLSMVVETVKADTRYEWLADVQLRQTDRNYTVSVQISCLCHHIWKKHKILSSYFFEIFFMAPYIKFNLDILLFI